VAIAPSTSAAAAATLLAFAADHPFATVVSQGPATPEGPGTKHGGTQVSHLPLLVQALADGRPVLRGHLARDNDQLAHFAAGADAVAVFHGPHGFVSPSVYEEQRGVPTWNYVVVHLSGPARLLDAAGLQRVLSDSAARFDRSGWQPRYGEGWPDVPRAMLEAIAGFEIRIERFEGKWKLSQNRSESDRARVIAWLDQGDADSQQVAALMRQRERDPKGGPV